MGLFSKKKKYEKYESEMILRLHAGLRTANKENTSLYKKIKLLTAQLDEAFRKVTTLANQVKEAYKLLSEMSEDRDAWQDKYLELLKKYKELKNEKEDKQNEILKAPSTD